MLRRTRRAFTLVELLTVIAIIILVAAMAMPNFIAMMKNQRWGSAIGNIQGLVMRARALATSTRHDFSVEFKILDNGTTMWIESESNDIERIPNLWDLEHDLGGQEGLRYFMSEVFVPAGGSYQQTLYENKCANCGTKWTSYSGSSTCPQCSNAGAWNSVAPIIRRGYYYNIAYDSSNAQAASYADNARQSDNVPLGLSLTIDRTHSPNFINWDSPASVGAYGYDDWPDIRIGTNGALVQAREPTISILEIGSENRRSISIVRCTGRVVAAP